MTDWLLNIGPSLFSKNIFCGQTEPEPSSSFLGWVLEDVPGRPTDMTAGIRTTSDGLKCSSRQPVSPWFDQQSETPSSANQQTSPWKPGGGGERNRWGLRVWGWCVSRWNQLPVSEVESILNYFVLFLLDRNLLIIVSITLLISGFMASRWPRAQMFQKTSWVINKPILYTGYVCSILLQNFLKHIFHPFSFVQNTTWAGHTTVSRRSELQQLVH